MDKRRITSIITESAKLYHENLEDKKILFVYAVPSEIYKQLDSSHYSSLEMSFYEVAFHSSNLMSISILNILIASSLRYTKQEACSYNSYIRCQSS